MKYAVYRRRKCSMAYKVSGQSAVFIDMENMSNIPPVLDTLTPFLNPRTTIRRAYGNFFAIPKKTGNILSHSGFSLINSYTFTRNKNTSDFFLTIDVMHYALSMKRIKNFIIVSGDSDFIPLYIKLRELRKNVIVVTKGRNNAISSLSNYCNTHIKIDSPEDITNSRFEDVIENLDLEEETEENIHSLVLSYVKYRGEVNLGDIKPLILKHFPAFKLNSYNHTKMSKFLEGIEGIDMFKRTEGQCVYLRVKGE